MCNETIDNLNEKNLPSRTIKITVATLERELESWKLKYKKLQVTKKWMKINRQEF